MTTPDFKRLETVFQRAVELDGQEHAAFLEQACCGDAVLRGTVEDLLARDAAGKTFPAAPAPAEPVVFGEGVGALDPAT